MSFVIPILLAGLSALAAPLFIRWHRLAATAVLSGISLTGFFFFLGFLPQVGEGEKLLLQWGWWPELGVNLAFRLDGLSLLFALLISGVGTFIVWYGGSYLRSHPQLGRFYLYLLLFKMAMLGLVLADNLIVLFIFWELTSITSYLLIGFKHESETSRGNALQALLITGLGGLSLLAGVLLLGMLGDTFSMGEILQNPEGIAGKGLGSAALILLVFAAFTKSAQLPFHFWLPNAMAAPTPVSAYLHSATMVKAGVYLLARFQPLGAEFSWWSTTLILFGAATMGWGAYCGLWQKDLKRILAYTTLSVLGMLTLLIGVGTELAIKSMVLVLLGHGLYKSALFMVAGRIDLFTGTRDVTALRGLRSWIPITAAAAFLAALSKSGFPPFFGFLGKEYVYKAGTSLDGILQGVLLVAMLTNMLLMALALKVGIHPFFGKIPDGFQSKEEKNPPSLFYAGGLSLGPLLLGVIGIIIGLFPALLVQPLSDAAAGAILGDAVEVKLKLWAGFNIPLLLSVLTLAGGLTLYLNRRWIWRQTGQTLPRLTAEGVYQKCLDGVLGFAGWQTRILQNGSLHHYLVVILMASGALVVLKFILDGFPDVPPLLAVRSLEWVLFPVMGIAGIIAAVSSSRLVAITALGVVGFGVALIFAFFGAPDLAITQIIVETLTLVLFLFVIYRLPLFKRYSRTRTVVLDGFIGVSSAVIVSILVLKALELQLSPSISEYFAQASYLEAKGRNIVNVILVDFRALDTLGEIFVIGIAALGVGSLVGGLLPTGEEPEVPGENDPQEKRSLILAEGARLLLPMLILLSIFVLYRGHNEPGGGFIGGLVGATAIILYAMGQGLERTWKMIPRTPIWFISIGLLVAVTSAFAGPLAGKTAMEGLWLPTFELPVLGTIHLGTPLIFDVGVYLTVVGFTTLVALALKELRLPRTATDSKVNHSDSPHSPSEQN